MACSKHPESETTPIHKEFQNQAIYHYFNDIFEEEEMKEIKTGSGDFIHRAGSSSNELNTNDNDLFGIQQELKELLSVNTPANKNDRQIDIDDIVAGEFLHSLYSKLYSREKQSYSVVCIRSKSLKCPKCGCVKYSSNDIIENNHLVFSCSKCERI